MPVAWARAICGLAGAIWLVAAMPGTGDYDAAIADAKAQMLANPSVAHARAASAQRIAQQEPARNDREVRIATAEWLQGEAAIRTNDFVSAAPLVGRALARLQKTRPSKLLGDLKMSQAGISQSKGNVAASLAEYQSAHNIFRDIGETRSQSLALIAIGALYQTADDNINALKYYDRALEAYRGDPNLLLSVYNNRGIALKDLGRYQEAKDQFGAALELARRQHTTLLEARVLGNIARLQIANENLTGAEAAIRNGLMLARSGEAAGWRAPLKAIAADVALKRGDVQLARRLIEEAFGDTPLDKTDVGYREAHYSAYEIYNALGDKPRALAHLQAMKRLDDQVWKLTASTNTALMAARFDSANQEARIARLKADDAARQLAMAEAQTRFQQILFAGIVLGALVVLGLLGFGLWQSRRARIRLSLSNTALERALAAKTEFLATTSHEIRTPLNGILGMTQVMLADNRLDTTSRDRVGIVHDAGLTMRSLVDDILDVAKMETGHLTVEAEPFDLKAMLEDVTRLWAEQAKAKELAFRLELAGCPRGIVGDAGRVRQMVYNLLSNAVKFTAAGSVVMRATGAGDRLTLAVVDTGIGIAPAKHEEIFESFKQADGGTTRQFGGTGLGLAIVRNIATAMHGTVSVDSAAGAGATFTVELPLIRVDMAEPVAAAGGLLVVDKNPIARAMLKAVLEPRAGRVVFAGSCTEAADLLKNDPELRVLVDDATARAEEDPFAAVAIIAAAAVAPVTVLWANLDDATRAALVQAGAAQVIAKPIAGPALASALYACNTEQTVITRAA